MANSTSKSKTLSSARDKSPHSSASSDVESASGEESSSDEQSVETDMLQQISDVSFIEIQYPRSISPPPSASLLG